MIGASVVIGLSSKSIDADRAFLELIGLAVQASLHYVPEEGAVALAIAKDRTEENVIQMAENLIPFGLRKSDGARTRGPLVRRGRRCSQCHLGHDYPLSGGSISPA